MTDGDTTSSSAHAASTDFSFRYYSGHKGRYGHEYLEFEVFPNGKLRYFNNSNYKNDSMIKKEMYLSPVVLSEFRRIFEESNVLGCNDEQWPSPNVDGKQELELILGQTHYSLSLAKINTLAEVSKAADSDNLRNFYFLVQDLKALVFSLVGLHFKIKPV
ncbi:Mago nashi-like protein [Blastocladiella britannica]|nr:Mago nashi-like protein [Blastocladiella britannica]